MLALDFNKKLNIYFIGIGGISMSAIAKILYKNGFNVSGSDMSENDEVKKLKDLGIEVHIGHKSENIIDNIDVIVYSKAIHSDNEEIIEAKKKNKKILSRSEILGSIMANYKNRLCVAGTHGKTTTTSMLAKMLLDNGFDPTINVGGEVGEFSGNTYIGNNKNYFIVESCEYTNSFLDFCPTTEIITNIDDDHLDFFKDINDIINSFNRFIDLLADGNNLIINMSIENIVNINSEKKINVITFGETDQANFYYKNQKYDKNNFQTFDVYKDGINLGNMKLKMIGRHNILNFLGAFACAFLYGLSIDDAKKSLENFSGASRRLEIKCIKDGITYMDDYAHHPTEIKASLTALSELNYNKMFLIFQPHTFSRTKLLFHKFVDVLSNVDCVILSKIYAAREIDDKTVSSYDLMKEIISVNKENNKNNICEYFEDFIDIKDFIKDNAKPGDLVVTMGAGDIVKLHNILY